MRVVAGEQALGNVTKLPPDLFGFMDATSNAGPGGTAPCARAGDWAPSFGAIGMPPTSMAAIVRRAVRATALGEDPGDMSSVENPQALEEIAAVV